MNKSAFIMSGKEVSKYLKLKESGLNEEDIIISIYLERVSGSQKIKEAWVGEKESLFPYFHKLATGENALVKFRGEDGKIMISGYRPSGKRHMREYKSETSFPPLKLDNPRDRWSYFTWITTFLKDPYYLKLNHEEKIKAIKRNIDLKI